VFILERVKPLHFRQEHGVFGSPIGDLVVRVHEVQLRSQRLGQIAERQALGLVKS
jgi:hypothetical protein